MTKIYSSGGYDLDSSQHQSIWAHLFVWTTSAVCCGASAGLHQSLQQPFVSSHKCQELIADTGDHLRTAGAKTREVRPFLRWTGNDLVRGRLFISSRYLAVCTLFNRSIIYLHDMDQSYSVNYFSVRLYLNSSWAKANLTITLVMEHFSLN